jgi:hypothetical protein
MSRLLPLWDLLTSDVLTLSAACILALALLGLLLLMFWPSGGRRSRGSTSRSHAARALAAAGLSMPEIARQTGLSRDAIIVLTMDATPGQRQKAPQAARPSRLKRLLGGSSPAMGKRQPAVPQGVRRA